MITITITTHTHTLRNASALIRRVLKLPSFPPFHTHCHTEQTKVGTNQVVYLHIYLKYFRLGWPRRDPSSCSVNTVLQRYYMAFFALEFNSYSLFTTIFYATFHLYWRTVCHFMWILVTNFNCVLTAHLLNNPTQKDRTKRIWRTKIRYLNASEQQTYEIIDVLCSCNLFWGGGSQFIY